MKMKSFAMLAMSGLLTASIAYVAPAMADDLTNSGQSMQAPSDNSTQNQNNAGSAPSDNMNNNTGTSPNDNMNNNNNGSSNSSDQGSPDTATGDDDY